jgi:spermidine synthase
MKFTEQHNFITQSLKVEKKLFETKSKYQKIEVYKSKELGNILALDETAMLSDYDEFIYHEMLSHVPLLTHKNPKNVLIIGGGDGGVAREVLKHPNIHVDMVEIDSEVVEVCKKYFPDMGDWKNPRLNLLIEDGIEFVKSTKDKSYDVVLVDSTDEKEQASVLFSKEFYNHVYRILKDDGVLSLQGSSYFVALDEHKRILKRLNKFPILMPYRYEMLVYPGIIWNFILASKKHHPLKAEISKIDGLKYYNKEIHYASFALPEYLKRELDGL